MVLPAILAASLLLGDSAASEPQTVSAILAKFDKDWKAHTDRKPDDQSWKVRMECLVGLAKIGRPSVSALVDVLKTESRSPHTRACAAQALGFLGDPSARLALEQAIEDKDAFVRLHATKALGRLGRVEAVPKYRKIAEKGDFAMNFALTRDDSPDPEAIRRALTHYDLSQVDAAQAAPEFSLSDTTGKTHRLSEYRGKKAFVLVFLRQIW
jgi:HEAT repeat protein